MLDNSITGMTGHQQNPTTGLNVRGETARRSLSIVKLCEAVGVHVGCAWWIPYDMKALETGRQGGAGRPTSPPSSSPAVPARC